MTMKPSAVDPKALSELAGMALGILLGGLLGPIVFAPLGLNAPEGAALGAFLGVVFGYPAALGIFLFRMRRRDKQLQRAAEAARNQAGAPASIVIKVRAARVTLSGEAPDAAQALRAEQAISTLPGIAGVTNRIRLKPPASSAAALGEEIRRRIRENLLRHAERDGQAIHVYLHDSRVVLEGMVDSWDEASQAEETAWNIAGIEDVENRLEVGR